MVSLDDWISDYIALLGDGTEEGKYLSSIPWILDANPQTPDVLIPTLRMEAARFQELSVRPTFSLLTVLRDTGPRHLRELILSCRCLSYQDWNLVLVDDGSRAREHLDLARDWCARDSRIHLIMLETPRGPCHAKNLAIEQATGDYLILVDGEGVLHPMALGLFARHINEDPNINLVFSNEAEIDRNSTRLANFLRKPPFDSFTLLRVPYLGRLLAVRRRLLEDCTEGGPVFRHEYEGIEEHDLWLRLAMTGRVVSRHIPLFAYYRRAGFASQASLNPSSILEKRRRLLAEHVPRAYPGAVWTANVSRDRDPLASSSVWISNLPGQPPPRLLVVVPFKDQVETTIKCLESIERQEHTLDLLVVLVNNRSAKPVTRPRLLDWMANPRTARYELLDHDGAFNFARLNNSAIARFGHERDLFLFMNNDVELSAHQALQVMAMQLLADRGIGFVGIKLYYPGGNDVQHGGVRFVEDKYGSGYYMISHARHSSEFVDTERVSLCVTFACAMTRRETYQRLGGLEEVFFPNSLGDADICLRALDAGYRNYYLGSLTGIHHESISRGNVNEDVEYSAFHERHGQIIASWRHRHLNRSRQHAWPLLMVPYDEPFTAEKDDFQACSAGAPRPPHRVALVSPSRMPLRYRLADLAVTTLKMGMGPVYGHVRPRLARAGMLFKRLSAPGSVYTSLRMLIKPLPFLGPASAHAMRAARRCASRTRAAGILACRLWRDPSSCSRLGAALRTGGYHGFLEELSAQVPSLELEPYLAIVRFKRFRPSRQQLEELRSQPWPASSPSVTIVMPVYNIRETWLRAAVESVLAQTYPHWELVCVNDASPAPHIRIVLDELDSRDSRVRVFHLNQNQGVSTATNLGIDKASGEYICFMDHDDYLEPHALHRFAEAILEDRPDMLYSDEAVTGEDIENILRIDSRPAFSYDHYLGHPYFVHLIAARTELVRKVGGFNETMVISQDVDLNLRLIEVCQTICHVPEVLYRWRTHPASLGHQKMHQCRASSRQALERHFARTRQPVVFDDESHFNYRDVRFRHNCRARVVILVVSLPPPGELRCCLGSLERTVDPALADIVVIAHQADTPGMEKILADVRKQHHVLTHSGHLNLSEIINSGVAAVQGPYTHYLILSPEIEAIDMGWLEHMLGYGQRTDVGVVGALLLGQTEVVYDAGLILGRDGLADHAFRGSPFRHWIAGRNPGRNGSLLASRDVSAVSAACMLTRADVFHRLNGFDERLVVLLGDADYCLRASALGYKTIHDAYSVLLHRGNDARSTSVHGQHPEDVRLFRNRHRSLIEMGDLYHHPILGIPRISSDGRALGSRVATPQSRTIRVVLPPAAASSTTSRVLAHEPEETSRVLHSKVRNDASWSVYSAQNRQSQ